MINSISVYELKKLNNINIIDIRSLEKYNNSHILNSISLPYNKIILNPDLYLKKTEIYCIYCERGIQSNKLCQFLAKKGFNVINVLGGYQEWETMNAY